MVASCWPSLSSGSGLSRHSADSIFRYGDPFAEAAS